MGQQFYVIRRNPAPGSPAAEALERRKAEQGRPRHPRPSTAERPRSARAPAARWHDGASRRRRRRPARSRGGRAPAASATPKRRPKKKPLTLRCASRPARPGRRHLRRPPEDTAMTESPEDQPTTESAARRGRRSSDVDRVDRVGRVRRATEPASRPTPAEPPTVGRAPPDGCPISRRRARSRPTTSRACSTSPTSTATSTWTSRATAPLVSVVGGDLDDLVGPGRRGARGAAGADPAGRADRETGERSRLMLDIGGLPGRPPGRPDRAGHERRPRRSRPPASRSGWSR